MSLFNPLATALSRAFGANARPSMELAFSQLQNTLIRRLNTEIEKVNDLSGDNAKMLELRRVNKKFSEQLAPLGQYIFDNQSNMGKLDELSVMVSDLGAIFGSDGDAADVTAQEAADFVAKRDEVVAKIGTLYVLSHPDVANMGRIRDLLDQVDTLQAMVPDVGPVDPAGTTNPNNNRVIADFVTELANKVSVAYTVSEETVYMANQMYQIATEKVYQSQADMMQLSQVDQAQRVQEIDNLKVEYANLLKALSLSYEVSLYYSENLSNQLNGVNRPPSGSVLNMFS